MRRRPDRPRRPAFSRPSAWGLLRLRGPDSTPGGRRAKRDRAGFTLVEVLIALALFALIGVAGFTLLDSVLRTQHSTETRLARMAEIQRGLLVVSSDLDQLTGSVAGGAGSLSLRKTDIGGGIVNVRYDLAGDVMTRTVSGAGGERVQTLITGVSAARWSFHRRQGDWLEQWPLPEVPGAPAVAGPQLGAATRLVPDGGLTAVALDLTLVGLDGRPGATVRRVASIPLTDAPQAPATAPDLQTPAVQP